MLKPPPPVVVQAGSTLWLSYAIMTSTMIFRLPQLIKVCRAKSVAGLNPLSFEVEMYGSALCVLNGFRRGLPVDLWGEHIMNGTQSVLLVAMIYLYEGGPIDLGTIRRCLHALGIAALYATGLNGAMPAQVIYRLYDLQNAAVCVCRFAQVHTNWQRGSTGQLSLVTRAAMVFGNCVRIFTTIKNNGGVSMLFGHVSSVGANGYLLAQCIWYYKVTHVKDTPDDDWALTPIVARRLGYTRGGGRRAIGMEEDDEEDTVAG